MQAAQTTPAEPRPATIPVPSVPLQISMDREFIVRNQIVERYLAGRLPLKGAQDFERYCREHPELLDEIGLSERINAALRLVEAGGRPTPWEAPARAWWERPSVLLGAAGLALILGVLSLVLVGKLSTRDHAILALQHRAAAQALDPAQSTRSITLMPSRSSSSPRSLVTVGGSKAEMADLKIDVSWSGFNAFRVTLDRVDQGRVAVLHNVLRDSNGVLHLGLNSSALGPGDYEFSIDGLTWRGDAVPQAWATITIAH
ncbi:MAG TPA: hypothetical protein VIX87_04145 [Steroidobacteraceae bacterium]